MIKKEMERATLREVIAEIERTHPETLDSEKFILTTYDIEKMDHACCTMGGSLEDMALMVGTVAFSLYTEGPSDSLGYKHAVLGVFDSVSKTVRDKYEEDKAKNRDFKEELAEMTKAVKKMAIDMLKEYDGIEVPDDIGDAELAEVLIGVMKKHDAEQKAEGEKDESNN